MPLREENRIDCKEAKDGVSMGAREGRIQEGFVKRQGRGPPCPSFVYFLIPNLATAPLLSLFLCPQMQKQVCDQETQTEGFTCATYSDGSSTSPAPTLPLYPAHILHPLRPIYHLYRLRY